MQRILQILTFYEEKLFFHLHIFFFQVILSTEKKGVFAVVFKGRNRAQGLGQNKILSANVAQSKGDELSNSKNGRRGRLWEQKTKNMQTALVWLVLGKKYRLI